MSARVGHPPWLEVHRGDGPLIVSFPHTGIDIPADIEAQLVSPWLSRKDADWWVHLLYDFVRSLGATTVRTALSRTVIDVNRDPSGASLYPGQATTELCPTTTFDGEPLYSAGAEPDETEIARRRATYFDPYHDALAAELRRLRELHVKIVLYEAHRSCRGFSRVSCRTSTSARTAARVARPRLPLRSKPRAAVVASRTSRTAASKAVGPRAITATPSATSTRYRWSSPAAAT
jgi:N-formylglutamate amidohydrolase